LAFKLQINHTSSNRERGLKCRKAVKLDLKCKIKAEMGLKFGTLEAFSKHIGSQLQLP
jgi:hypothetical protein